MIGLLCWIPRHGCDNSMNIDPALHYIVNFYMIDKKKKNEKEIGSLVHQINVSAKRCRIDPDSPLSKKEKKKKKKNRE